MGGMQHAIILYLLISFNVHVASKSFEAARMSILGYFSEDFEGFKPRDWIQFNTFIAIGIDNSYCTERILNATLEGYVVNLQNWEMEMYIIVWHFVSSWNGNS